MICEAVGELVVERCWCGIQHAIPRALADEQARNHELGIKMCIYCPLGHSWIRGRETAAQKDARRLADQLARERQQHDQTKADLREKSNLLNAEKAAKSRLKNRIGKGVCPCCNRTFVNVQRHMATKHPEMQEKGGKA